MGPDRQVLALAERLRVALERDAPDDQMERVRAILGIRKSSGFIDAFRTWFRARSRVPLEDPAAPDHEWLRDELDRLCAAYETGTGRRNGS